jgi:hypothetical protein
MRWEDERYIRWFTRNTPEWCLLSWQARGLFGLILRELDRAGILELGKVGLKAVAVAVRAPWDEIEKPLAELIADGCLVFREELRILLAPNFIAAQEANQSDKARQRSSRERARDLARAMSQGVVRTSQVVTLSRETESQGVTEHSPNAVNGHSVLSQPSQSSQPPRSDLSGSGRASARVPDETSPEAERAAAPPVVFVEANGYVSPFDMARRIYAEAFRKRYKREFQLTSFGRDGSDEWALVRVGRLAEERGDMELWLRHWMRAFLRDDDKWLADNAHPPRVLERRLNKYGEPKKPKPPAAPKEPEPAPVERPFVPLRPITSAAMPSAASSPDELAAKARADKARLEAKFGKGNS